MLVTRKEGMSIYGCNYYAQADRINSFYHTYGYDTEYVFNK